MSFVRIHTCLPATDEGRMNEYVWSDVAFTQTIVVYVPVVGSLPATFVAYANTKLSPSVFAECRATMFKVNVVPGRPGSVVIRQQCSSSLASPPVDDQLRATLSNPPVAV